MRDSTRVSAVETRPTSGTRRKTPQMGEARGEIQGQRLGVLVDGGKEAYVAERVPAGVTTARLLSPRGGEGGSPTTGMGTAASCARWGAQRSRMGWGMRAESRRRAACARQRRGATRRGDAGRRRRRSAAQRPARGQNCCGHSPKRAQRSQTSLLTEQGQSRGERSGECGAGSGTPPSVEAAARREGRRPLPRRRRRKSTRPCAQTHRSNPH